MVSDKKNMNQSSYKWDIAAAATLICMLTNDQASVDQLWKLLRKERRLSPLECEEIVKSNTTEFVG